MKVLITGGAGYLGSIITERFIKADYQVTIIDNLSYNNEYSLFHLADHPRFNFVYGDASDRTAMKKLIKDHEILIPLAAIVGASACEKNPNLAKLINYEAIKMLNKLRSKDQIIIYPCTNSGYGTKSGEKFCDEDTPLEPISLYGRTKVESEKILLDSGNVVTLRLATVFGLSPRMRIDLLVNYFVYKAMFDKYIVIYDKDFKRNYVHIKDVADAFLFVVNNFEKMKDKPYNLGLDDANLSKEELAGKVKLHFPEFYIHYAPVGHDPDRRNYIVSNERIKSMGFSAKRSIDQGIVELKKGFSLLGRNRFQNA